jgi:hypothetical protein
MSRRGVRDLSDEDSARRSVASFRPRTIVRLCSASDACKHRYRAIRRDAGGADTAHELKHLSDLVQKSSRGQDSNIAKRRKLQKMQITGDDDLGVRSKSAFNNTIVSIVLFNDGDTFL